MVMTSFTFDLHSNGGDDVQQVFVDCSRARADLDDHARADLEGGFVGLKPLKSSPSQLPFKLETQTVLES